MKMLLACSHWLRRYPGGRQFDATCRGWRLRTLAKWRPAALGRYDLDQLVLHATHGRVMAGPFHDMQYLPASHGSVLAPKLLGTYELELHAWLARLPRAAYRRVMDIGCAEGFYAVGLARLLPEAEVIAYDRAAVAREATRRLAEINDVAVRMSIRETCAASEFQSLSPLPTLVFCDIEGGEQQLLDPGEIPQLTWCDLLVEVHDTPPSDHVMTTLRHRFASSHELECVGYRARTLDDWPVGLPGIPRNLRVPILEEGRTRGLHWLFMRARRPASADQRTAGAHDG